MNPELIDMLKNRFPALWNDEIATLYDDKAKYFGLMFTFFQETPWETEEVCDICGKKAATVIKDRAQWGSRNRFMCVEHAISAQIQAFRDQEQVR